MPLLDVFWRSQKLYICRFSTAWGSVPHFPYCLGLIIQKTTLTDKYGYGETHESIKYTIQPKRTCIEVDF